MSKQTIHNNADLAVATQLPEDTASAAKYSNVAAVLAHFLLFGLLYTILYFVGLLDVAPNDGNLLSWDVGWYYSIVKDGYAYREDNQSNTAFFPLFPYLWRLTGLSTSGISLVNLGLLTLGSAGLATELKLEWRKLLLFLSTPLMFFSLVPYTEALFFFCSAVFLAGLHRENKLLIFLGLFGCCCTRSAATLFVPAYVFTELVSVYRLGDLPRFARNMLLGLGAIGSALGLVMLVLQVQTGEPLAFYKAHKYWQHIFTKPQLPLYDSSGSLLLWINSLALVIGLISVACCTYIGLNWLIHWFRKIKYQAPPKPFLFSIGYFTGATGFILFYQNGDLVGLGRYEFTTAFFMAFLWFVGNTSIDLRKAAVGLLVFCSLVAVLCGAPYRMNSLYPSEALFYWGTMFGYLLLLYSVLTKRFRLRAETVSILYMLGIILQAYLLSLFVDGIWVG